MQQSFRSALDLSRVLRSAGGCDAESQSAWLWLSAVEAWEGQPFVAAHGLRAHKNKG